MRSDDLKIEELARLNPLAYGISYIDLLQGMKWEIHNRKWSPAIYQAANPASVELNPDTEPRQLVLMKPTQIGMSTMGITKLFHFADFWPVRIIYMLPRQQDYLDFVTTRIDPMLLASKRLRPKVGTPNSTRAKQFGHSYLFFMEATVEPRMMPADALMVDEIDLCDPDNVGTATNRLDNSAWKLRYYYGTPTLANYGSHGRYLLSNKNTWLVKCPSCGNWQEMDWEKNLRVIGNPEKPEDLFLGCINCNHRFTVQEINNHGMWVPENPEVKDIIGFQISQLMVFNLKEIYKNWLDPEQTLVEFYRKRLGKPYEVAGGSVTREDILTTCFQEPYSAELMAQGGARYFMGVDQGNELQVVIAKQEPLSKVAKIVHAELVPYETLDGAPAGFHRVRELMNKFKITRAVMDGNPNRHPVKTLQKDFIGRVVIADYTNILNRFEKKRGEGNQENIVLAVNLNRTQSIDDLMESIRHGGWRLFGNPSGLPPIIEILISQVTALKRDIEKQKKTAGLTVDVAVWRKLRPDHFAHAMLYAKMAIELSGSSVGKFAIIGSTISKAEEAYAQDGSYYPTNQVIAELVPVLAEVRQEQATLYFQKKSEGKLEIDLLPNPIKHKVKVALEKFKIEDIEWVLQHIADYDNAPIKPINMQQTRTIRVA